MSAIFWRRSSSASSGLGLPTWRSRAMTIEEEEEYCAGFGAGDASNGAFDLNAAALSRTVTALEEGGFDLNSAAFASTAAVRAEDNFPALRFLGDGR